MPRGPGPLLSRRPRRLITVEKTRYPRFLGDPCVHAPLFDPGGPPAPGHYRTGDVVFRTLNNVDSAFAPFEARSRGLHALCVRFAAGVAPDHATLDSGWWPALTGQDSHLLGRIDGLPSCLSVYMASSITKLRLAQAGWPRAVTHPRLPQIRTCPIRAYGSSDNEFAAQRYTLCTRRAAGRG